MVGCVVRSYFETGLGDVHQRGQLGEGFPTRHAWFCHLQYFADESADGPLIKEIRKLNVVFLLITSLFDGIPSGLRFIRT